MSAEQPNIVVFFWDSFRGGAWLRRGAAGSSALLTFAETSDPRRMLNATAANDYPSTASVADDLALAALALIAVVVLATSRNKPSEARRAKRKKGNKPPKWQQKMREGTAGTTFVIGIVLSVPGVAYFAALDRLHKLHYSIAVTVLVLIGINLVQLILLEIPMVAFEFAPRRTPSCDR